MSDARFAKLPAVHALVDEAAAHGGAPRWALVEAARRAIAAARAELVASPTAESSIDPLRVAAVARELAGPALHRVINATGVVLHTNLGRAPLAAAARAAIDEAARGYSNLEYDLDRGERGSRHDHLRSTLCELTGAEDAIVVNNNAAATVLGLAALATDREIIVSRGELIEIGGSFRLPEILKLSRGVLVEVGTTNKTHAKDYERAITERTGLLLKVHRSNFAIVGFTSEVSPDQLVAIGRARNVPTMIDLGSGALVDRPTQRAWGLPDEPTVSETVATGADLVTFSGDKLLGGPQAGIAVGTKAAVAAARTHPLMRALRPDKLTLSALAATLALYRANQLGEIPTTRMLGVSAEALRARADRLAAAIGSIAGVAIAVEACMSTVGGGAMPTAELPSFAVTLAGRFVEDLDPRAPPSSGGRANRRRSRVARCPYDRRRRARRRRDRRASPLAHERGARTQRPCERGRADEDPSGPTATATGIRARATGLRGRRGRARTTAALATAGIERARTAGGRLVVAPAIATVVAGLVGTRAAATAATTAAVRDDRAGAGDLARLEIDRTAGTTAGSTARIGDAVDRAVVAALTAAATGVDNTVDHDRGCGELDGAAAGSTFAARNRRGATAARAAVEERELGGVRGGTGRGTGERDRGLVASRHPPTEPWPPPDAPVSKPLTPEALTPAPGPERGP